MLDPNMQQIKLAVLGCGFGALLSVCLLVWALLQPDSPRQHLDAALQLLRATDQTATITKIGGQSAAEFRKAHPGAPEQGHLIDLIALTTTDEPIVGEFGPQAGPFNFEARPARSQNCAGGDAAIARRGCLIIEVAGLDTLEFVRADREWLFVNGDSGNQDEAGVQSLLADAPVAVPRRPIWLSAAAAGFFSLACLLIIAAAPRSPLIFISYRRKDNPDGANRLYRLLRRKFGPGTTFLDTEGVPAGADFRRYVDALMRQAKVALILIGDRWEEKREDNRLRIMDADDLVRIEIETALANELEVLPVLMGGATMPGAEALPASLQELPFRNASSLDSGRDFDTHFRRLAGEVAQFVPILTWTRYGAWGLFAISASAAGLALVGFTGS